MALYVYVYVNHAHLYNWSPLFCCNRYLILKWSNGLYNTSLLLLNYFVYDMYRFGYVTPTNYTDYSCLIKAIELI